MTLNIYLIQRTDTARHGETLGAVIVAATEAQVRSIAKTTFSNETSELWNDFRWDAARVYLIGKTDAAGLTAARHDGRTHDDSVILVDHWES